MTSATIARPTSTSPGPGSITIGAPVWNREERVVAALSVSGGTERITAETIDGSAARVREAALAISRELGHVEDTQPASLRHASGGPARAESPDAA